MPHYLNLITDDRENIRVYIADIRNLIKLDTNSIHNILNMSDDDKLLILNTYNDVVDKLNDFIDNL